MRLNALILEAKEELALEKSLEQAFSDIASDIPTDVNESAALTIAGTALALPELLKIIGKVVSKVSKYFKGTGATGEKLVTTADKAHHFLVGLLEKPLKLMGLKGKALHKTADVLFHVIVASLMIAAGYHAIKAIKTANFSMATLEGALAAIKNREVQKFIAKELAQFTTT